MKLNSKKLFDYTKELDEIFAMYIENINPFIVRFEVAEGEFPAEIQNEIRALYGHMVRAAMADSPELIQENIAKMKNHSKRALLDCFKYTSILCSDKYDDFMQRYEGIDLTYLEEGKFLPDVVKSGEYIAAIGLFTQYIAAFLSFQRKTRQRSYLQISLK